MSILRRTVMWLVALFWRDRVEHDLEREMRFHLDMETEQNIRRGMTPDEARRAAMLAFGGVDRHKESARDERGTRFLEVVASEFRLAVRSLRLNRGFSLVTTLTLAVGIGATAAVFSFANWVLYRPVPGIVAPDELALVSFEDAPGQPTGISYDTFEAIRDSVPAFSGVTSVGFGRYQISSVSAGARGAAGQIIAGDYFGVLGVKPEAGRLLQPDELTPHSGSRSVVLSDALATAMFGSARDAVGQSVRINAVSFVVVGVTAAGFRGTDRVMETELWLPNAAMGELRHDPKFAISSRQFRPFFTTIGRFRDGASTVVAQVQLRRITAGLVARYPQENRVHQTHPPTVYADVGSNVLERELSEQTMELMLGIAGLALLIACANVAGLLLFRGLKRRSEIAVRRALGASTFRVLGQHLAEGVVIGVAGAAGGVFIADLLRKLFEGQRLVGFASVDNVNNDARVLLFVVALALTTGIIFGLVPGLAALAHDRRGALRDAGRRATSGGSALRSALTVGQIAASVSLVVGALLLARTIAELRRVDIGFDAYNLYAFSVEPEPQGYSRDRVQAFRAQLTQALRRQGGVEVVSTAWSVPFRGVTMVNDYRLASSSSPEWTLPDAQTMWVGSDYFRALRIPVFAGRALDDQDMRRAEGDSLVPAVINATAARKLFGTRTALGEVFLERGFDKATSRIVVGVVGDTRDMDLRSAAPNAIVYKPFGSGGLRGTTFLVRSTRPYRDVQALVEREVAAIDAAVPVLTARPLTELVAGAMAQEVVFLRLVGLLAAIAAVLAGVGLYALLSFGVAARTREIGVRMALGARQATVVSSVARQGGRLLAIGVVVGLVAAVFATRLLESRLFGVSRLDPLTYVAAVVALILTGVVACALPARQAARVDPATALRAD